MTGVPPTDSRDLVAPLELFAHLLLHELDAGTLVRLRMPEVRRALAELGIQVPDPSRLESLAATYYECWLQPERGAPPIASLWIHGQYEGQVTVQLRKIAAAVGCELDTTASAGAPIDHLGCLLLLWAQCSEYEPALADLIVDEYLDWAPAALEEAARRSGFYGQLARALQQLLGHLATRPAGRRGG